MMDKNNILDQVRAAKAAHISWVQKAKLLIEGFEIDRDSIPVNSTECRFGRWFYSDAQKLNSLRNNSLECMTAIEAYHADLHDVYLKIFKLYYDIGEKGFFAKLFGKKKKIDDNVIEEGRELFEKLQEISKDLLGEINRLERRIIAIPEEEFKEL